MKSLGWISCCAAVSLALAEPGWAQKASNWRVYKASDGLPESSVASVTIGPRGRVWVKHLNSDYMSWLDGYQVKTFPSPGDDRNRVYESAGGQLWTVYSEGLEEYQASGWIRHPVEEIRADSKTNLFRVSLAPIKQGHVFFLLPDRLMEFNVEDPSRPRATVIHQSNQTRLGKFTHMTVARDGGLWIAGAKGLAKVPGPLRNIRPDTEWREYDLARGLENLQEPFEDDGGGITTTAESLPGGERVVAHFDGQQWSTLALPGEKILLAWRGLENTYWVTSARAGAHSLFQVNADGAGKTESEEVAGLRFFDLAIEPKGVFWLATSEGLFRYAPSIWSIPKPARHFNAPIRAIAEDNESRLWFVSLDSLSLLQNEEWTVYPFPKNVIMDFENAGALFSLGDGSLVINAGDRLLQFHPKTGSFDYIAHPAGANVRSLGLLRDGTLCVQTRDPADLKGPGRLELYDGTAFKPFPYPEPEKKPGNELTFLFTAQDGSWWLGGNGGALCYRDGKWQNFQSADEMGPEAVLSMIDIGDGRVWCGTRDKIWECDGKRWSLVRAGYRFDRVNALLKSRDGSIWAASNNGLYRFYKGAWAANSTDEGLSSAAIHELHEDWRGRIWAGTARGPGLYHPEADPDPPRARADFQKFGDEKFTLVEGASATLLFTARDKWKYTPVERLLYSYRMDDKEWSPFQDERSISLTELPAGNHFFKVRAMDRNWNVDPNPLPLQFSVAPPWFKETRLIIISGVGALVALFFAVLAFNRHLRLLRSYAEVERQVALRTRQLENAHRELLHSEKMNALGTLAAGIAHDFNNILSIIKGSVQIIEDNLENRDKVRVRVGRIKTVVEQGTGIVKAMLGFSRASDQQLALCDANEVVSETIKLLGDRFLHEVRIQFEPARGLPEVPGSKDFIQQILLNFIFNAVESLGERREIILRTARTNRLPPHLVLPPAAGSAYVLISVKDFGCGISPEIMPRVFEPFFTTKAFSSRRGTGLGLSMVYELARKMDAGLAAESIVGQGSVFTLILPIRDLPGGAKD
jgi:signal transduction histidine kinase/ligand-binding sensor domain-containing protein